MKNSAEIVISVNKTIEALKLANKEDTPCIITSSDAGSLALYIHAIESLLKTQREDEASCNNK